jgi:hypothetical protein
MEEASIKGVILLRSWGELNQLIDEGRITRQQLELRLSAAELQLLDEKIEASLWYPISAAASFGEIVGELTGNEGPAEWVQRGFAIAENILDNPNIGAFFDEAMRHGENAGAVLVRMSSLLLNFGEMSFEGDLEAFCIPFKDAGPLPEVVRYSLQGVIHAFAERVVDSEVELESERLENGTIIFSGALA